MSGIRLPLPMRVRDVGGYKNALNVLWESVIFFGQITVQRYLFFCLQADYGPYISSNFLI